MRKGFDGLSLLVQETLKRDPARWPSVRLPRSPRRSDQVIWHDGQGMCPCSPSGWRRGRFLWPSVADGTVDDLLGATWLPARRHRLAGAAEDVAAARRGIAEDKLLHSARGGSQAERHP